MEEVDSLVERGVSHLILNMRLVTFLNGDRTPVEHPLLLPRSELATMANWKSDRNLGLITST